MQIAAMNQILYLYIPKKYLIHPFEVFMSCLFIEDISIIIAADNNHCL